MNCHEGYLSITFLFDHHVQTSVMNVDCAYQSTLLLSSFLAHLFLLLLLFRYDEMHTQNASLLIMFNIRSDHLMNVYGVYTYVCCWSNRHLKWLLFFLLTDLCSMSSLLNRIMNRREKSMSSTLKKNNFQYYDY